MGFHFKIDSMVVVCCINKQKSCNYEIFKINKIFWLFCKKRKLWAYASFISSKQNKTADAESRKVRDKPEWSLKEDIYRKIIKNF